MSFQKAEAGALRYNNRRVILMLPRFQHVHNSTEYDGFKWPLVMLLLKFEAHLNDEGQGLVPSQPEIYLMKLLARNQVEAISYSNLHTSSGAL